MSDPASAVPVTPRILTGEGMLAGPPAVPPGDWWGAGAGRARGGAGPAAACGGGVDAGGAARLAADELFGADARAVVGQSRVVLPTAGVGVELIVCRAAGRAVGGRDGEHLIGYVREVQEGFDLWVALRGRVGIDRVVVGLADVD